MAKKERRPEVVEVVILPRPASSWARRGNQRPNRIGRLLFDQFDAPVLGAPFLRPVRGYGRQPANAFRQQTSLTDTVLTGERLHDSLGTPRREFQVVEKIPHVVGMPHDVDVDPGVLLQELCHLGQRWRWYQN